VSAGYGGAPDGVRSYYGRPFVFAGSAAAAGGGPAMALSPAAEAGPALVFAATGAAGNWWPPR
jgi:hypothetical protein